MRISDIEKKKIIQAINSTLKLKHIEIRLFGSRINDNLKGGDIDLMLVIDNSSYAFVKKKKLELLVNIKKEIGEQKIDLIITTKQLIVEDPFHQIAYSESVQL